VAAAPELAAPLPTAHRSYLICATPRTGSYLLCGALEATGVAGHPTEYLMPRYREYWSQQWGTADYAGFHERVVAEGTTPNGVFGTKIHAGQLLPFIRQATNRPRMVMEDRPAVLDEWFGSPRYLWLRRRDQVRQAVSWTRAVQSREWWDIDEPPVPLIEPTRQALRFDYAAIERALYSLADWDGVWRTYFACTGITPLTVWYEDLAADREGTVQRVLEFLGLERPDRPPVEVAFRRQSDGTSSVWASRFGRLHSARREGTLAALAGAHAGETVFVCASGVADRVPRDAVTISVDGSASPAPATYALVTRPPAAAPSVAAVLAAPGVPVRHPWVIRYLTEQTGDCGDGAGRRLAVPGDATPAATGAALARHLGAANVELV
jgi:LPS sulfotransferase NodH